MGYYRHKKKNIENIENELEKNWLNKIVVTNSIKVDKIKKYVINLKRKPDRLKNFINSYPLKEDLEIIYGFDGKNTTNELEKEIDMYKTFKIKPGEKGCFISHLRIYEKIINENIDYALIIEDDAIFCENFNVKFQLFINELPADFDIAYIGGRFNKNFIMKSKNCISISPHVDQHPNNKWINCEHDRTTHSYIISNKLANILFNKYKENRNISNAIDNWILVILFKNNIKIYNSRPHLCYSHIYGDSDTK